MGCRTSILQCCSDKAAKVHAQATDILRVFTDTSPVEAEDEEGVEQDADEGNLDVYGV